MKAYKKKVGIFLGRLQPQHKGHEDLIKAIFKENDEVVLCIGSAQKIKKSDPTFAQNPLGKTIRIKRLKAYLSEKRYLKPYRIVFATDIQPERAWPKHLKKCCRLDDNDINTIYFSDHLPKHYKEGLKKVGFKVKFRKRTYFLYKSEKNTTHKISSATEIRSIEKNLNKNV
jgi:cytidyltransferase-like protein